MSKTFCVGCQCFKRIHLNISYILNLLNSFFFSNFSDFFSKFNALFFLRNKDVLLMLMAYDIYNIYIKIIVLFLFIN